MPAIALVGAYASISAGIAAGAATLLGGIQIAAGVMTGIGALTGNKKLLTLGAVASMGAGIYSAATASGASSAASGLESVGGEGVSMGGAAGNAGSNAAELGMTGGLDAATSAVAPASQITGFDLPLAGDMPDYLGGGSGVAQQSGGLVGEATAGVPPVAANDQVSNAVRSGTSGTPTGTDQAGLMGETAKKVAERANKSIDEGGLIGTFLQKLDGAAQYLKANPEVGKLGMGLVGGVANNYGQQQLLQQREQLAQQQRNRYNASILNQQSA